MTLVLDILSWVCIVSGGIFCLLAGIGLMRLPDAFTRMHAASLGDTMGTAMILLGLLLQVGIGGDLVGVKLILILVFMLATSPVATHALAHAALVDGVVPWTRNGKPPEAKIVREDLREDAFIADTYDDVGPWPAAANTPPSPTGPEGR